MSGIPEKMVAIARSLDDAGIAFAFGGALALAWCTERARGTVDIDMNVFSTTDQVPDRPRRPTRGHRLVAGRCRSPRT